MTETKTASTWLSGFIATVLTTLVGLGFFVACVFVLSGWTSTTDVFKNATLAWLFASGSSVKFGDATVGLVPLGLLFVKGMIAYWISAWTIRNDHVDLIRFVISSAGSAAVVAGILAVLSASEAASAPVLRSAVMGFVVIGAASMLAVNHMSGQVWYTLSPRWWPTAEGVAATLMLFFGFSTLLLILLLATSVDDASNIWATLYPQSQGILLGLILLLAVPTAVVAVSAVLLGTTVSLGEGAYINLAATHVEQLPIFPLLVAVPDPGPHPTWVMALGLVPLLSGAFGGVIMVAKTAKQMEWKHVVIDALRVGVVAGIATGIFIASASGGLGTGALNEAGTQPWLAGLIAVAVFSLGAVTGASAAHYRLSRVRY